MKYINGIPVPDFVYSREGRKFFPCGYCNRAYAYKKALESHQNVCHQAYLNSIRNTNEVNRPHQSGSVNFPNISTETYENYETENLLNNGNLPRSEDQNLEVISIDDSDVEDESENLTKDFSTTEHRTNQNLVKETIGKTRKEEIKRDRILERNDAMIEVKQSCSVSGGMEIAQNSEVLSASTKRTLESVIENLIHQKMQEVGLLPGRKKLNELCRKNESGSINIKDIEELFANNSISIVANDILGDYGLVLTNDNEEHEPIRKDESKLSKVDLSSYESGIHFVSNKGDNMQISNSNIKTLVTCNVQKNFREDLQIEKETTRYEKQQTIKIGNKQTKKSVSEQNKVAIPAMIKSFDNNSPDLNRILANPRITMGPHGRPTVTYDICDNGEEVFAVLDDQLEDSAGTSGISSEIRSVETCDRAKVTSPQTNEAITKDKTPTANSKSQKGREKLNLQKIIESKPQLSIGPSGVPVTTCSDSIMYKNIKHIKNKSVEPEKFTKSSTTTKKLESVSNFPEKSNSILDLSEEFIINNVCGYNPEVFRKAGLESAKISLLHGLKKCKKTCENSPAGNSKDEITLKDFSETDSLNLPSDITKSSWSSNTVSCSSNADESFSNDKTNMINSSLNNSSFVSFNLGNSTSLINSSQGSSNSNVSHIMSNLENSSVKPCKKTKESTLKPQSLASHDSRELKQDIKTKTNRKNTNKNISLLDFISSTTSSSPLTRSSLKNAKMNQPSKASSDLKSKKNQKRRQLKTKYSLRTRCNSNFEGEGNMKKNQKENSEFSSNVSNYTSKKSISSNANSPSISTSTSITSKSLFTSESSQISHPLSTINFSSKPSSPSNNSPSLNPNSLSKSLSASQDYFIDQNLDERDSQTDILKKNKLKKSKNKKEEKQKFSFKITGKYPLKLKLQKISPSSKNVKCRDENDEVLLIAEENVAKISSLVLKTLQEEAKTSLKLESSGEKERAREQGEEIDEEESFLKANNEGPKKKLLLRPQRKTSRDTKEKNLQSVGCSSIQQTEEIQPLLKNINQVEISLCTQSNPISSLPLGVKEEVELNMKTRNFEWHCSNKKKVTVQNEEEMKKERNEENEEQKEKKRNEKNRKVDDRNKKVENKVNDEKEEGHNEEYNNKESDIDEKGEGNCKEPRSVCVHDLINQLSKAIVRQKSFDAIQKDCSFETDTCHNQNIRKDFENDNEVMQKEFEPNQFNKKFNINSVGIKQDDICMNENGNSSYQEDIKQNNKDLSQDGINLKQSNSKFIEVTKSTYNINELNITNEPNVGCEENQEFYQFNITTLNKSGKTSKQVKSKSNSIKSKEVHKKQVDADISQFQLKSCTNSNQFHQFSNKSNQFSEKSKQNYNESKETDLSPVHYFSEVNQSNSKSNFDDTSSSKSDKSNEIIVKSGRKITKSAKIMKTSCIHNQPKVAKKKTRKAHLKYIRLLKKLKKLKQDKLKTGDIKGEYIEEGNILEQELNQEIRENIHQSPVAIEMPSIKTSPSLNNLPKLSIPNTNNSRHALSVNEAQTIVNNYQNLSNNGIKSEILNSLQHSSSSNSPTSSYTSKNKESSEPFNVSSNMSSQKSMTSLKCTSINSENYLISSKRTLISSVKSKNSKAISTGVNNSSFSSKSVSNDSVLFPVTSKPTSVISLNSPISPKKSVSTEISLISSKADLISSKNSFISSRSPLSNPEKSLINSKPILICSSSSNSLTTFSSPCQKIPNIKKEKQVKKIQQKEPDIIVLKENEPRRTLRSSMKEEKMICSKTIDMTQIKSQKFIGSPSQGKNLSSRQSKVKTLETRKSVGKKLNIRKFEGKEFGARQFIGKKLSKKQLVGKKLDTTQSKGKTLYLRSSKGVNLDSRQCKSKNVGVRRSNSNILITRQFEGKKFGAKHSCNVNVNTSKSEANKFDKKVSEEEDFQDSQTLEIPILKRISDVSCSQYVLVHEYKGKKEENKEKDLEEAEKEDTEVDKDLKENIEKEIKDTEKEEKTVEKEGKEDDLEDGVVTIDLEKGVLTIDLEKARDSKVLSSLPSLRNALLFSNEALEENTQESSCDEENSKQIGTEISSKRRGFGVDLKESSSKPKSLDKKEPSSNKLKSSLTKKKPSLTRKETSLDEQKHSSDRKYSSLETKNSSRKSKDSSWESSLRTKKFSSGTEKSSRVRKSSSRGRKSFFRGINESFQRKDKNSLKIKESSLSLGENPLEENKFSLGVSESLKMNKSLESHLERNNPIVESCTSSRKIEVDSSEAADFSNLKDTPKDIPDELMKRKTFESASIEDSPEIKSKIDVYDFVDEEDVIIYRENSKMPSFLKSSYGKSSPLDEEPYDISVHKKRKVKETPGCKIDERRKFQGGCNKNEEGECRIVDSEGRNEERMAITEESKDNTEESFGEFDEKESSITERQINDEVADKIKEQSSNTEEQHEKNSLLEFVINDLSSLRRFILNADSGENIEIQTGTTQNEELNNKIIKKKEAPTKNQIKKQNSSEEVGERKLRRREENKVLNRITAKKRKEEVDEECEGLEIASKRYKREDVKPIDKVAKQIVKVETTSLDNRNKENINLRKNDVNVSKEIISLNKDEIDLSEEKICLIKKGINLNENETNLKKDIIHSTKTYRKRKSKNINNSPQRRSQRLSSFSTQNDSKPKNFNDEILNKKYEELKSPIPKNRLRASDINSKSGCETYGKKEDIKKEAKDDLNGDIADSKRPTRHGRSVIYKTPRKLRRFGKNHKDEEQKNNKDEVAKKSRRISESFSFGGETKRMIVGKEIEELKMQEQKEIKNMEKIKKQEVGELKIEEEKDFVKVLKRRGRPPKSKANIKEENLSFTSKEKLGEIISKTNDKSKEKNEVKTDGRNITKAEKRGRKKMTNICESNSNESLCEFKKMDIDNGETVSRVRVKEEKTQKNLDGSRRKLGKKKVAKSKIFGEATEKEFLQELNSNTSIENHAEKYSFEKGKEGNEDNKVLLSNSVNKSRINQDDGNMSSYSSDSDYEPYEEVKKLVKRFGKKRGRPVFVPEVDETKPLPERDHFEFDSIIINNEHVCISCGKVCKDFIDFEVHKKQHMSKIRLDDEELQKYDEIYKRSGVKRCPICNTPQETYLKWKRHATVHSKVIKFFCRLCKKGFVRNDHRLLHEKRHVIVLDNHEVKDDQQ